MAATEEKRERIKWYHARRAFFDECSESLDEGLQLARECLHEDARFLCSLFPDGAPATHEEAAAVFLVHKEDARCCCWGANIVPTAPLELLRQSATAGYAYAQVNYSQYISYNWTGGEEVRMWQDKALTQGEPEAMMLVALRCEKGTGVPVDKQRAEGLWREASELGEPRAQFHIAESFYDRASPERFVWLRRSAIQKLKHSKAVLVHEAVLRVANLKRGGSGRLVFEIGAALSEVEVLSITLQKPELAEGVDSAVGLYAEWCRDANRALVCWLWLSRQLGVAKDIRLLIADLIWASRSTWGDRY